MEAEEVLLTLKKENIKILNICLIDLYGQLKCMALNVKNIDVDDLKGGFGFDGSSILGYSSIDYSDLVAVPDLKTFKIVRENSGKYGLVLANTIDPNTEKLFLRDPRNIVKNFSEELKKVGLEAFISPEIEFFLFKKFNLSELNIDYINRNASFKFQSEEVDIDKGAGVFSKEGYFNMPPHDKTLEYRIRITEVLEEIGINVIKSHHEVATPSQMELNIIHSDVADTCDNFTLTKFIARILANEFGLIATFMPKPIYGDNGSGLHLHISIWKNGKNLFYDESDEYAELSQEARYFIGGVMEHAKALAALAAPTVNSYKRLIAGFEAPVYISWSKSNRSAMIRIPFYKKGDMYGRRIEVRFPDPLTNPYLSFTAIISAGLEGIRKKVDPGDPSDFNMYRMRDGEYEQLPRDLWEALDYLEGDDLIRKVLGEELVEQYIELKRSECLEYRQHVSIWEYLKYLNH